MHSTSSQRQFPQGAPSTTSQRTLRALQDTQARAARRFVTLPSVVPEVRFLGEAAVSVAEVAAGAESEAGGGDAEPAGPEDDRGEGESPWSDIMSVLVGRET